LPKYFTDYEMLKNMEGVLSPSLKGGKRRGHSFLPPYIVGGKRRGVVQNTTSGVLLHTFSLKDVFMGGNR